MRLAFALALFFAVPVAAEPSAHPAKPGAQSAAEPIKATNAQDVRVSVAARPQRALGVHIAPEQNGWRLQLRAPAEGTAEIFDVTPGTPALTRTLRIVAGLVSFDLARFAGGHTYHVAVKSSSATGASMTTGLVYLYPYTVALKQSRRPATTRVRFDEHDKTPPPSDTIVVEKKGSL